MRIMFISRWYPYPPDNGSKIRIFNMLKQLAQQHEITLCTFGESTDRINTETLSVLKKYCFEVRVVPFQPFRPHRAKALFGFISAEPRFLVDTYSEVMARSVQDLSIRHKYDLVIVSQLSTYPYALQFKSLPVLLEELELSTFKDPVVQNRSKIKRARANLTLWKLSGYLRRVLSRAAACTVVSEVERDNLKLVAPNYDNVRIIPNAVDYSSYDDRSFEPARPNTLIFSGALTYLANYDAVSYFLNEIFPLISAEVPDLEFRITGRNTGLDLTSLPYYPGVKYTGHVEDISPVVAGSWVSVVPLRLGGGTRLKILEAMALGTPVVSTSKGAEGLEVEDGQHILIADTPEVFAKRTVDLLRSSDLRTKLSDSGRRLVKKHYDWTVVGEQLNNLLDEISLRSSILIHHPKPSRHYKATL